MSSGVQVCSVTNGLNAQTEEEGASKLWHLPGTVRRRGDGNLVAIIWHLAIPCLIESWKRTSARVRMQEQENPTWVFAGR